MLRGFLSLMRRHNLCIDAGPSVLLFACWTLHDFHTSQFIPALCSIFVKLVHADFVRDHLLSTALGSFSDTPF